jgi:DNA-binding transcriptional ArsR family regulator
MAPPARPDPLRKASAAFKLLGDEGRLRLVVLLASGGARCASDLAATLGYSLPGVSLQLRLLRLAGLIARRRRGRRLVYSLADGRIRDLLRGLAPADPERVCACP